MAVVLAYEEDVLRLIYGHVLQSGKCSAEKQAFHEELKMSEMCIV